MDQLEKYVREVVKEELATIQKQLAANLESVTSRICENLDRRGFIVSFDPGKIDVSVQWAKKNKKIPESVLKEKLGWSNFAVEMWKLPVERIYTNFLCQIPDMTLEKALPILDIIAHETGPQKPMDFAAYVKKCAPSKPYTKKWNEEVAELFLNPELEVKTELTHDEWVKSYTWVGDVCYRMNMENGDNSVHMEHSEHKLDEPLGRICLHMLDSC
jgi:hypothetical protein